LHLTIPGGCLKDWGQEDPFECSMLDALMLVGLRPRWLHASIVGEFDHKLTFSCLDSGYFRKSLFSRYIAYELTKMSEICMLTFVVPLYANILLSLDFASLHHAINFLDVVLDHIISRHCKILLSHEKF